MYMRRAVKCRNWLSSDSGEHIRRSAHGVNSSNRLSNHSINERTYLFPLLSCHESLPGPSYNPRSFYWYKHVRAYSSEGDGRSASEKNQVPVKGTAHIQGEEDKKGKHSAAETNCTGHSRLAVIDQEEWLANEKSAIERRTKESPFLSRREKFRNELSRRVIPWERIPVTLETFPYYIHEHTKNLLLECAASHLKHRKFAAAYGAHLAYSSGRILLQSIPGTELYRERLVRALARELKVPLLVVDSDILFHFVFDSQEDRSSESGSDEETALSGEECTSDPEFDDVNDASHEADAGVSSEERSQSSDDDEVDFQGSAEALKKLVPHELEEVEEDISNEYESSSSASKSEPMVSSEASKRLKKGDRVKYVGPSILAEADSRIVLGRIQTSCGPTSAHTILHGRPLSSGDRGEVYEVNGDRAAVILDVGGKNCGQTDDMLSRQARKPSVYWIDVKDLERDLDNQSEDYYVALKALCEVVQSHEPLVVYFSDFEQLLSTAVPKSDRKEFLHKAEQMFDNLTGSVVFICGQNRIGAGPKEKGKITMVLPNLGRLAKLPFSLKRLTEGLKGTKKSTDNGVDKLFNNVLCISTPKEDDLLRTFNKQIEEDRRILISRSNLNEIYKVLERHGLSCTDLLNVNTDGVILTAQKAEKVVGWAKNHYLATCNVPSEIGERLQIPHGSIKIAILRLKELEAVSRKTSQNLKNIAKDEYETNFISSVVPSGEIGIKFDDIGALEEVKRTLNELVALPMRRPELFRHGNLLRPCKGILLFGPPGTGKTLLAKALATEAGANFISITGSSLTSKWFGDAEKLTKALFSFATKLAPVIVFVDEVDSLLGARGGAFEHEATRRMRNEFMAAWDGLRSKDSERILILGATNRPFDLDDAVIRRLPRRIYVDLPDAKNRLKILKIFLAQENIELAFEFEKLANETDGYSGSDLKNLCIAAAYRPVQELLEIEERAGKGNAAPILRPLTVKDFIQAKAKVGPSVAYDAASMNELRKWNEQYGEDGSRRSSPFGFGD